MDKPQLPKMLKKLHLLVFLVCSLIGLSGYAQTFPVTISTQITQPSPIYLSNYADATTINSPIKIQLVLNDLTISNRQVRLKFYFQGNSISFSTNDFVVGARPLYLEGGFPLQLTNVDLAPYFEFQNILGLNPNQYAQPLPEGIYNFSVEVYDFATNKKLSKKTNVTTIIFQNEPPFLNLPLNNASIMQSNIQNIIFSWTPRSINVSNVEYEFSLVEIWDNYTPVQNAFAYSPPLYTTTTRNTTFQYGMSQPQLIPGKKYAWRIKAKAILGAEEIGVFKNNGYSEIFSFNYEVSCTSPLSITTTGVSEDQAKVSWSGNIDNFDYQVNYREKNANSEWYKVVTPRESITISNLKPNATYEYTVGASCDVGKYTHSTIHEFTTLAKDEIAFAGCGIKPDPKDLANKTPLPQLFPNDVVTAGDFPIVVLKATGSNGNFTGEGYVTLPFLEKFRKLIDAADALGGDKINLGQFSRIRITFNNIGVNTDFKLISGEIVASYDPDWKNIADGDKILTDVLGSDGKPVEGKLDYEVRSATLNPDGSTTIIGADGQTSTIAKSVYDQVYTDSKGNTVNIPANGKGEPTISNPAAGGKAIAGNTNGVSSSGEVAQISSSDVIITFKDGPGKYAFDQKPDMGSQKLKATYEVIPVKGGSDYNVNYKAVSDLDGSDTIIAEASFKNGKTKDDIVFKTNSGAKVEAKWTSNTKAEITLTKTLNFAKESIIATVNGAKEKDPKDATKTIDGKSDVAGKVNIWQLPQKTVISVTLLSVNGAVTPTDSKATAFLNEVYNKVGVKFDVTTQKVTIGKLPNEIECGDSDVFNVYTGGQNDIISQIESIADFKYNEKTYYVLYTGKSGQNGYDGFMPLGGQYAFVFDNSLKTAAHELGHGIFGLKHPFSTKSESGKTNLLMDYGAGTVLSHNDWDIIHSGGWKFYGFQKSSSGALAGGYGITPNWGFVKTNENTVLTGEGVPKVAEGMLGGFESTENNVIVNYIWNIKSNTYKVNGTGADYPTSNYVNISDDKAIIWLIYKNNEVCNNRKYIRTNYGAIKSYIPKQDQAGLDSYIDKIDKIAKADKLAIYSSTLGCVGSNTSGNTSGGYVYAEYKLDGEVINISSDNKSKLDSFFTALSEVYGKGIKVITYPKGSSKKGEADAAYQAEINAKRAAVEVEVDANGTITKAVFNIESIIGVGNVCIANLVEAKIAQKKKDNPNFNTEGVESIIFKVYYSLQSFVECSLGEENNKDSFLAGFLYEFCQTLDIPQLLGGLKELGVGLVKYSLIEQPKGYLQQMKNIFEISKKLANNEAITQQDLISVVINPAAYEKYKQVKEAAHNLYGIFITKGNPWRYGRLTMMVVPVVLTLGEYSAVVAARLGIEAVEFAKICQTLNRVTNLGFEIAVFGTGKIIKPITKGLSTVERTSNVVTSNLDEIVALTDDVTTNETILASVVDDVEQLPKNVVSLGTNDVTKAQQYLSKIGNAGDKVYVIVHGSGETFSVVRNGMSDVVMNHKALAYWLLKNNLKNKNIVLLSCSDLNSAQNLVNKLGGTSKVTAWEGAVTVFENGAIRGEGACKEFSPGNISKTLSESEIPKGTAGIENGEKVVLGGAGNALEDFANLLNTKGYSYLKNQFNALDDVTKNKFMRNFPKETPDNILAALNDPKKGLLNKWKDGTIKGNPEGFDKYYYASNDPLTHADIGDFKNPSNPSASLESGKMAGGGHGQSNIDYLEATGKQYNIEHTFDNGVRTGNIPTHDVAGKRTGVGQSWFPTSWTKQEIDAASKYVIQNNQSAYNALADGVSIYDTYKGVRVGIIKTDGKFATAFPDSEFQPNALGQLIKNPKY
ncbi:fibronectin type III domain protein [Flavobacterium chryseum]|uniref:EndoU domain-containing protein n=1 Tax=Flavobacterium sp. P3160 TaxID=2512113 RepID=UPI00105BE893|nr:EndoU domain-containing protein [Flavobacterium sp. P3160]TDO72748.1 fibronectin type III domain protein [Flavobacterium sp. P3160]